MFGSLRLQRGRVSAEDREVYRAQFCGACHSLREFGGRGISLLTNYDQTLWVTLAVGLQADGVGDDGSRQIQPKPCTGAPWRRVDVQGFSPELSVAVAALDIGVVGAKLRDDVQDEGRWRSRAALWWVGPNEQRALRELRKQGFPVRILRGLPERQAHRELVCRSLEAVAGPSAGLMAALCVHAGRLAKREDLGPVLARFGAALGAAIYGLDALEDMASDRAKGRFNAVDRTDGDPAAARRWALAKVERCREELSALDQASGVAGLRAHGRLVAGVLDTLASRLCRLDSEGGAEQPPGPVERVAEHRQAGDCDCSVCCDAGACDGAGCGDSCGCCEICICCEWGSSRQPRRREKKKNPSSKY